MYATYTVAAGDTLYGIAKKFGMTTDELTRINGLTSSSLKLGQQLRVVAPAGTTTTPPTTNTADKGAKMTAAGSSSAAFQVTKVPEGDFQRITITVPNCGGQTIQARMRDNINYSSHMVYAEGVSYAGMSNVVPDVATIQQVGLSTQQARALQYVSTHEGKFDAINSYDKAIFSYGFIQFAGAAAVGASLNRVMASMKTNASAAFNRIFQSVGIDVSGGVVTANGNSGDNAWLYIQKNLPLYGAFIQAGFDKELVREQLRMANDLYVQPALNWKLDVNVGGINVAIPKLSSILKSEAALTIVIALAINQGNGGMGRMVADAVGRVGAQSGLNTAAALAQVDERKVFETLIQVQTDKRVLDRVNGVLGSGMSFGKV
ncbi:MAG: LysM peptidoglycan-binding domain-containing protein [Saprospiraceae bacterium]|nr:LysM peptidoglycan-binding domain-containing protein [Saprospiraceae bacterium]